MPEHYSYALSKTTRQKKTLISLIGINVCEVTYHFLDNLYRVPLLYQMGLQSLKI